MATLGADGRRFRPTEAKRPDELEFSFSPPIKTNVGLPAVAPNRSAKRCLSVFAQDASVGRMTDSPSMTTGIAMMLPVGVAAPTGVTCLIWGGVAITQRWMVSQSLSTPACVVASRGASSARMAIYGASAGVASPRRASSCFAAETTIWAFMSRTPATPVPPVTQKATSMPARCIPRSSRR